MRANVKPLTHWLIYRGYKVRFSGRSSVAVTGVLTTPTGEQPFVYDPVARVIALPGERIAINDYGWELAQEQDHDGPTFRSSQTGA